MMKETAICSHCNKDLKEMPPGTRDLLPTYWLSFCNALCVDAFIRNHAKKLEPDGLTDD